MSPSFSTFPIPNIVRTPDHRYNAFPMDFYGERLENFAVIFGDPKFHLRLRYSVPNEWKCLPKSSSYSFIWAATQIKKRQFDGKHLPNVCAFPIRFYGRNCIGKAGANVILWSNHGVLWRWMTASLLQSPMQQRDAPIKSPISPQKMNGSPKKFSNPNILTSPTNLLSRLCESPQTRSFYKILATRVTALSSI